MAGLVPAIGVFNIMGSSLVTHYAVMAGLVPAIHVFNRLGC
jgi:hypothetical protein